MRNARYHYYSKHFVFAATALTASACAVGPDFVSPAAPSISGYTENAPGTTTSTNTTAGNSQNFVPGKDIPAEWWKLFSSEALDALIKQSLDANPDIQAAEASLRQAKENVYAGEGAWFPSVNANAGETREKFSPAAFGNTGSPAALFTLYNASVSVSYGIDIFGGNRREVEELRALADVQNFQREAAYLTLAGNVVTAAVQEASLKAQLKATQDIVDLEAHQLDVLKQQFKLGAIPKTAVLAQETTLAQEKTLLAPLKNQLSQVHTQLAALSGRFPNEKLEDDFELTTLRLPDELPVSLPSQLVEQRPDIRAAEAQLHAASAEIGVTTANLLPQITLTGSYGTQTTNFGNAFTSPTNVWNLGTGIVQPLFHGGQLWHQRKAAQAAYDKAEAQYRSTVLQAFKNVADSLHALQFDAEALAAQDNAVQASKANLDMSQAQFKDGAISYLSLLDAERAYAQARIGLVQAQAARFADTAALFQALGGGWWNKESAEKDHADADALCISGMNKIDPVQSFRDAQDAGKEEQ
jgi:NodT family efflux transporter outer membrane factor (OMF) lipoprotein